MEKNYIPGTRPEWNRELPDEDNNSLVDKHGNNYDNGYNFDEKDDEVTYDNLAEEQPFDPEEAEKAREEAELLERLSDKVWYSGVFVDAKELYEKFPATVGEEVEFPHVTTAYLPDTADKLLLDSLGSEAKIRAIAYGNDGMNEGLLVEVVADDPAVQSILDERVAPDDNGELKHVPTHITLSFAENKGAEAVNTKKLNFEPLEEPVELTGQYMLHMKDNSLIESKSEI